MMLSSFSERGAESYVHFQATAKEVDICYLRQTRHLEMDLKQILYRICFNSVFGHHLDIGLALQDIIMRIISFNSSYVWKEGVIDPLHSALSLTDE
ncbi:hypothetical protein CHS0354_001632 [Potamilus streckersoni]|uniref:Uncharacterized protein n=1 Tax=Potamilus streckersoni TaxID=2493646 RepID=A0AAE0SR49_9BIVA|nr:hypothetical protein CHS0354_001632 [Potamilus streckersoni]